MRTHAGRQGTVVLLVLAALVAAVSCGGGGDGDGNGSSSATTTTSAGDSGGIVAAAANYELLTNRDQRFIAGLLVQGEGTVVSFGEVDFAFHYLGTKEKPIDPPVEKFRAKGSFVPVASADGVEAGDGGVAAGPRVVRPSEGLGVYRAQNVRFDAAGYWGVLVTATIDGKEAEADTVFEVLDAPRVPAPGQPAPRTAMPAAGATGESVDSRVADGEPIPDPELHGTSVADALAAGKPTVVVVSTPVFCVSKFCGPITDAVSAVAKRYADRVAFVHLEVWGDFEQKKLNPWAAEWIQLPSGDANEPWVFTIGRDGVIADRFDNVVGNDELEAAVAGIAA